MSFFRSLICITLVAPAPLFSLIAQNAAPTPTYDVSSVKPHDPMDRSMSWNTDGDGFRAVNVDLKNLISSAWNLRLDQVVGEPSWADDLHWDVSGKATELTPDQLKKLTPEQRNQMMQQLLGERFHIRVHLETRTGPVFTLVAAKGGIKLNPVPMTAEERASGKVAGTRLRGTGGPVMVMEGTKVPLSLLVRNLSGNLHRTVIDKTGLPADSVYDFTLRWARDNGTGPEADTDVLPMPLALEDQLGLHLQAGSGPVEVLVVDHLEKPAAN